VSALARLVSVVAVVTGYVALHLVISAGMDLRDRARFQDAPAHAAALVAALDRYAGGNVSAGDAILEQRAWFDTNRPAAGETRAAVTLTTDAALDGDIAVARLFAGDLDQRIDQNQAGYDRELRSSARTALVWLLPSGLLVALARWLRRRRRRSVADVVELVRRYVPDRPWWRRPVFVVLNGFGFLFLVPGFFGVITATQAHQLPVVARLLTGLGALIAIAAGTLILRQSRHRTARGAASALRADGRRPVLYLRSFADDETAATVDRMPGGVEVSALSIYSREEQLAGALSAVGPVIAVGRPGEPLPYLGAARFYLPDDEWRAGVRTLMDLSQLIVLRLGVGEGLWWEVEQVRATQPAHKLVLLMPGRWADLTERLAEHLPTPSRIREVAGGDPWTSAVVTFDQAWKPHTYPVPAHDRKKPMATSAHRVAGAMQAALAAVGVHKRTMALRVGLRSFSSIGRFLLLVPVAAVLIRVWLLLAG
jgi:hypothetical protein